MKRRAWLLGTTAGAGALLVGWGALPERSRVGLAGMMAPGEGDIALNGWIKVLPDNGVVLAMPRAEMGQGVHTALSQLAAEELDVPLAAVRIEQAGWDAVYGNVALLLGQMPQRASGSHGGADARIVDVAHWVVRKLGREWGLQLTAGSASVSDAWEAVRAAAATARATLLGAASLQWKLPAEELQVREGVVSHPSGVSASYGELARAAAATPPGEVQLKERGAWRVIGRPAARADVPAKVDGSARFGADVRLPDMRFAAVRLAPMLGGAPGALDARAALAMPGVERIVVLPAYGGSTAGFAVVARSTWEAEQAARAVQVDWRQRPAGPLDGAVLARALRKAVSEQQGHVFVQQGAPQEAGGARRRSFEAWYDTPFLAHAALEPMNATACVRAEGVEVWAPTQAPDLCREAAARVAGVPVERVTVHVPFLGGGFGRRLEVDYVAQAVRVAADLGGVPVQVVWSREQDAMHDFYRPMQLARLRATLDADGDIASLQVKAAGDVTLSRWIERTLPRLAPAVDLPDRSAVAGLCALPYDIPGLHIEHVRVGSGVPVGFWRSGAHAQGAFFLESFLDEIAGELKQDPLQLRRALLRRRPRHLAVLELAASRAGWGTPLPRGRGRGFAMHECFGSVVAQVAEVSLERDGPRVHRVVCAVDCGTVVNPAVAGQQLEGAVVFGVAAALHGKVDIRDGIVQHGNFLDVGTLRMAAAPLVESWFVDSDAPPAGLGVAGVPPVAPAVANALAALTGQRLRSLPLRL